MEDIRSDEELLKAFADNRDNTVFRELAGRYGGLIYHVALRSLGDHGQAQDVAQRVLVDLARKAGNLAKSPAPLPAWLHRATFLAAKTARRTEKRHQRKKEALMHIHPEPPSPAEAPPWTDALPHLDAAIDRLPETDRIVILLHYVKGMTFPQIAASLGKSAAAVQKQSRRAIGSLQKTLSHRGVALSATVLTSCLASEMAKAAPALAIPSVAAIGKPVTGLLVMKKSTLLAVTATVMLCGVPLARQQVTLHLLEARLAHPESAELSERKRSGSRALVKSPSLIERLARDLKARNSEIPRFLAATDHLAALDDGALIALMRETIASSMTRQDLEVLFGGVLDVLSERDVESALDILIRETPVEYLSASERAKNMFINGIRKLANADPESALPWFNTHLQTIRSIPQRPGFPEDKLENHMRLALGQSLVFSDVAQAIEVLRPVPTAQLVSDFEQMASNGESRLEKDPSGFIRAARELLPPDKAPEIIGNMRQMNFNDRRLEATESFLKSYPFSAAETDAILRAAGAWHFERANYGPEKLMKAVSEYRAWLEALGTDDIDRRIGLAMGKTVKSWPSTAESIQQVMLEPEKAGLGENAVIALLETVGSRLGVERSAKLAEKLSDRDEAKVLLERITKGEGQ